MGRRGYSAEFRRKVLDRLAGGHSVASVAHDLDLSDRRSITGAARTGSTVVCNRV